jgi:hypothetical protein
MHGWKFNRRTTGWIESSIDETLYIMYSIWYFETISKPMFKQKKCDMMFTACLPLHNQNPKDLV